jgi:hypothetical protein
MEVVSLCVAGRGTTMQTIHAQPIVTTGNLITVTIISGFVFSKLDVPESETGMFWSVPFLSSLSPRLSRKKMVVLIVRPIPPAGREKCQR